MQPSRIENITIDAEIVAPTATVQLARFAILAGEAEIPPEPSYRLDLSITPRMPNARMSYRDRWSANRFERLGKVFAVPPGEIVRTRTDGGRQSSVVLMLQADVVRTWLQGTNVCSDRVIEASLDVPGGVVGSLLLRLGREARHPGFASEALCESIAVQIAIELGRYYHDVEASPCSAGLPGWRFRLIEERLRDGDGAPSLSELAALCGISVRQLTRAFRASHGRSIGEHIAARRIERACELLAGDHSTKWVAYTLGFSSPSGFCEAFRRAIGQSPQQYRRRGLAR